MSCKDLSIHIYINCCLHDCKREEIWSKQHILLQNNIFVLLRTRDSTKLTLIIITMPVYIRSTAEHRPSLRITITEKEPHDITLITMQKDITGRLSSISA